jgi:eukaryotic-like serine/threonine-protein kinase
VEGRLVAIKAFRFDEVTPEQAAEFAVELEDLAANQPRHPGMAAALAAGVEGITPYLAQEYVAGEALDAALRQFGPPPSGETLTTLRRVADALDRAAGDGIHHGTLHPRDILIAEGGDARVIDLGVGQALMRSGLRVPVRRPYSAPERVAEQTWGGAADIYSLGAIAYELITGRRLSGSGRPHVQAPGISLVTAERLSDVLARALAEDPAERYPSAADLVDALAPLLPTGPPSSRKNTRPTTDLPLPLGGDDAAVTLEPFDPSEDLTELVHRTEADVLAARMIDDLPVGVGEATPRFTSLDDEPEMPAPDVSGDADVEPAVLPGARMRDADSEPPRAWPTPTLVLPRDSSPLRGPLLPMVMALVVGVAAGFGWGYWTAFRTLAPSASERSASAAAVPATSESVRVDEPEVIGERNLPSPAATARPTHPPTAAPPAASPRPAARPAPAAPLATPARPATTLPPGRLVVRSTPPGARVRVDGRVRGRTPLVLRDMPLRVVRVTVEREGFKADERRVALSAAQPTVTVDARLSASAPPPPEATTGALVIESRPPGASIFLDGRQVGTTPLSVPNASPGTRRIRLEMAGFSPWVTTANIQPGVRTRVAASLERGTPE